MAGRARRFVQPKTRRTSQWLAFIASVTAVASGGAEVLIASLNAAALALRPFTVVRTHLRYQVISDQVAATESQFGALAVAVVSEEASAVGITAMPSPDTDRDSDLFYVYEDFVNDFTLLSAAGFNTWNPGGKIDSKAMRKVNSDQDIVLTVGAASASDGFGLYVAGRMLIKLH